MEALLDHRGNSPLSEGALLAEELTIQQQSPLPSFLEMMFISKAEESAWSSIISGLTAAANYPIPRVSESSHTLFRCAHRFTHWLQNIVLQRYGLEVVTFLIFLMERKCLESKSKSSLVESFYGMKRSRITVGENSTMRSLSKKDRTRAAILLALLPYLKIKFARTYGRMHFRNMQHLLEESPWKRKVQQMFVHVYPWIHLIQGGTSLYYKWMYLLGKTIHFSPSLHALGMVVRRPNKSDMDQVQPHMTHTESKNSFKSTNQSKVSSGERLAAAIGVLFLVRALMSWLSEERMHAIGSGNYANCPPPSPPGQSTSEAKDRKCPICRNEIVNPAVASSGYVFCFKCIILHLREHKRCPVTKVACDESEVVRLFEVLE